MPNLLGIEVRLLDNDGHEFKEWGTQYLRAGGRVSTFVEARTDVAFRVSVSPSIPYEESLHVNHSSETTISHSDSSLRSRVSGNHFKTDKRASLLTSENRYESPWCNTPGLEADEISHPPPFEFLAQVYIDDRRKAERGKLIILDPSHPDFHETVYLNHRIVEGRDGQLHNQQWIFKDVGIVSMFDRMNISEEGGSHKRPEPIQAVKSTIFSESLTKKSDIAGIGRIVVEIKKVILKQFRVDHDYQPPHREEDCDIDMAISDENISHRIGPSQNKAISSRKMSVYYWEPYKNEEDVYATFTFFYRSRAEVLRKYGFFRYFEISNQPLLIKPQNSTNGSTSKAYNSQPNPMGYSKTDRKRNLENDEENIFPKSRKTSHSSTTNFTNGQAIFPRLDISKVATSRDQSAQDQIMEHSVSPPFDAASKHHSCDTGEAVNTPVASHVLEELRRKSYTDDPSQQSTESTVNAYNHHLATSRNLMSNEKERHQEAGRSPSETTTSILGFEIGSERFERSAQLVFSEGEPTRQYQDDDGLHEWLADVTLDNATRGFEDVSSIETGDRTPVSTIGCSAVVRYIPRNKPGTSQ